VATEAWLRGPIPGVHPMLMPAAHALIQVREELPLVVDGLSLDDVWASPGQSASIGFHLRHIVGSLDRLLTYARGAELTPEQRAALIAERSPSRDPLPDLLRELDHAIQKALVDIASTDTAKLAEARFVGKARLPSTVIGLVFHAAEHATRHAGQIATLVKVLRPVLSGVEGPVT
jgi:uncharacterized damage-inducible protein DinB